MAEARSLRDLFDDLSMRTNPTTEGAPGDMSGTADLLRAAGHPDLPPDLVAEALTSYAGTAPLPVAEHLSPFVSAWTGGEGDAGAGVDGLGLLVGSAVVENPTAMADPWRIDDTWDVDAAIDDLDSVVGTTVDPDGDGAGAGADGTVDPDDEAVADEAGFVPEVATVDIGGTEDVADLDELSGLQPHDPMFDDAFGFDAVTPPFTSDFDTTTDFDSGLDIDTGINIDGGMDDLDA